MDRLSSGSAIELPAGDAVFLDHLAHWVGDIGAAAAMLERLGFQATPYAEHTHSTATGEAPVPAGSANHCVMLACGYLEVLTPIGDTPIAREVRAALERYTGVHLAAFCTENTPAHRERLDSQGFAQRPCVTLTRESSDAEGRPCTLRFTVARPEVGCLAEGRVQFLTHHTPDELWQPRWMEHANGARALTDMLFCVEDAEEARARYSRYLDREPRSIEGGCVFSLDRGRLALLTAEAIADTLPGSAIPRTPCMSAYAIESIDLARTREALRNGSIEFLEATQGSIIVPPTPALGGTIVFTAPDTPPPWL
ncbi:MAG: VOC family protein, partial [Gammaproteobacteria bacterium]|nr:VOC family protein [Gammaproteobacteria bacterium]